MDIKLQTSKSRGRTCLDKIDLFKNCIISVHGQMEVLLQLQHPLDLLLSPFLISSQSLKQMKVSTHKEIIS